MNTQCACMILIKEAKQHRLRGIILGPCGVLNLRLLPLHKAFAYLCSDEQCQNAIVHEPTFYQFVNNLLNERTIFYHLYDSYCFHGAHSKCLSILRSLMFRRMQTVKIKSGTANLDQCCTLEYI